MPITFEAYQQWFRDYDEQRGLSEDQPLESLGHLMEEAGEIAGLKQGRCLLSARPR